MGPPKHGSIRTHPKPRQNSILSLSTSRYPVVIYVPRADGSIDRIFPDGQQRVPNIRRTRPRQLSGSKLIPLQLLSDSSDDRSFTLRLEHPTSIRSPVFIDGGDLSANPSKSRSSKSMVIRKELIEDCLEILRAMIVLQGEIADSEKRLGRVKIMRRGN
jgi:hypothetical protein